MWLGVVAVTFFSTSNPTIVVELGTQKGPRKKGEEREGGGEENTYKAIAIR